MLSKDHVMPNKATFGERFREGDKKDTPGKDVQVISWG